MTKYIALLLFVLIPSIIHSDGNNEILIIASYHSTYPFTASILQGLYSSFPETELPTFHTEFLDLKRHSGETYQTLLKNKLRHKYDDLQEKFQAVIVVDDAALDIFLELYGDPLPVIFCGINNFDPEKLSKYSNITGIIEDVDTAGTIQAAKQLQPDADKLFVIVDNTPSGNYVRKNEIEPAEKVHSDLNFFYISGKHYTHEQVLSRVRMINEGMILLSTWTKDSEGEYIDFIRFVEDVSEAALVPVYVLNDQKIGYGPIGGKVTSGINTGRYVAEYLKKILAGSPPDEIPILDKNTNPFIFDYQVMRKFGFSVDQLPPGSIVINKPDPAFLHVYRFPIIGIILFIIIQSSIIVKMLSLHRKNNKMHSEISRVNQYLEATTRSANTGLWDWTLKDNTVAYNDMWFEMLGYPPQNNHGTIDTWRRLVHPDDFSDVYRAIFNHLMGATEWYENQHRLKCGDGTWKWILDRGRVIEWDKSGKPIRFTGTHTDINRYKQYEFLIQQSLEEKEVLLHEIHHRVKNNLQIISSILNLQYPRLKYPELQEIFTDCKSRIQSIALVHEILYQHDDVSKISVTSYMNALSASVSSLYQNPRVNITINISPEDFALPIHSAIPIGIIVNEIISNSFKHAFPDKKSGNIYCNVWLDGPDCVIEISNDGISPESDFNLVNYETLGISLILSLTEQLGGKIVINKENGLSYTISFPQ